MVTCGHFFVLFLPCLFICKKNELDKKGLQSLKHPHKRQKNTKIKKKDKNKYFQYSKMGILNHTANLAKAEKQENPITPFCTINQKTQFNKPGISSNLQFLFSFHRATGFWLRRFLVDHNCYAACKCWYNLEV